MTIPSNMNTCLNSDTPIALTIAGSDSCGGAGIQADLKTFSANGVYGASVITAIAAQNTQTVSALYPIPADMVKSQIFAVLSDLNVNAIKIGMLFSEELVLAVAQSLQQYQGKVILDPVMVSKSGDVLLQNDAIEALKNTLIPQVDLITPNYSEAKVLLGKPLNTVLDESNAEAEAQAILELGAKEVLLKGGCGDKDICSDVLLGQNEPPIFFRAPHINTQNTYGAGCTYSSTIVAYLAKGHDMQSAVDQAHRYLQHAIQEANKLSIGHGHGPVHHFHNTWG